MTLSIYVSETITVADLVQKVKRIVARFTDWLLEEDNQIEEEQEEQEDNKAPPTLGIHVSDSVNTKDIFGK